VRHIPVARKGQKLYRYYVCTNAHNNGYDKCPSPSIPADEIERFVLERLVDLGSNEDLLDVVLEQAEELWKEKIAAMRRDERRLQLHLETLQQGDEPSDLREQRSVKAKLKTMRDQITNAEDGGITTEECLDGLGRFEELLNQFTVEEKTWLLKLVFVRIDYDGSSGKIKFHLQDETLLQNAVA
jgi:site-specific DNA recombinase